MAAVKAIMQARKLAKEMKNLTKQKKPNPVKTRKAYKLFVEGDDKELYPLFVDAKNKVPQGEFLEANFPDVAFTAPNGRMYVPSKGAKRGKGEKAKGTGDPVIIPDEKTRKKLIEEGYITDRVKRTEDAPFGKVTAVAARPGWHASQMPVATHIGPQDIKITAKDAETLIQAGITPEAIKKRGNQFYVKRRAEDHVYAEVEMADDVDYQSLLSKEGKTDINDRVPVGGSYKYVDGQADSDKWVVGGDMRVNRVLSKEETKKLQNELGVKDLPLRKEIENILGKKFYQGGSVTGDTMEQGVDDYILAKTDSNNIQMNKGGMSTQMELFEDGGLKDEGGMIDEVSGNDVPTGSTREEVRDDIPAQLSEGEFVLPADVVRYHGLEKIMALRDEAKQGLQKMEAMGQMGNSEEATLPDDVPFNMDDLDMEDEEEPQEMEMAEGGYVMVAGKPMPVPVVGGKPLNMQVGGFTSPTGTYQVPTNIATQPSYFQQYSQSTAPFQPFVPPAGQQQTQVQQPVGGLPQQQQTYPSFATLMPTVGGKRETIEYRNEAGQKLFIPFIDDKPIYPIPEGYTKYVAEEEPIAEDKPVTPTTTQVTTADGSDVMTETAKVATDFAKQTPEKVQQNIGKMGASERGKTVMDALQASYGTTGLAKTAQQLATAVTPGALASKMFEQKTFDPRTALSEVGRPDMASRDAITSAFGYDPTGYDFDDPMDASLAGIDQQNAINTAIFGGVMTGTEDKTRGGIQGITVADIQKEYGIAPSYTSRGAGDVQIARGTNPGQISSTGTFYDANGVGNDPDKAEYSSITDMLGYLSTASKHGYAGTLGRAKEQAKQGNAKAQAVVKDMQTKAQQKTQDVKDRAAAERGGTGDLGGPTDLGGPEGIGPSTGPGSQTIGTEDVDPTGGGGQQSNDNSSDDNSSDNSSGAGAESGVGGWTAKGGLMNKKKIIMHKGAPKANKRMKRGGLASKK